MIGKDMIGKEIKLDICLDQEVTFLIINTFPEVEGLIDLINSKKDGYYDYKTIVSNNLLELAYFEFKYFDFSLFKIALTNEKFSINDCIKLATLKYFYAINDKEFTF